MHLHYILVLGTQMIRSPGAFGEPKRFDSDIKAPSRTPLQSNHRAWAKTSHILGHVQIGHCGQPAERAAK